MERADLTHRLEQIALEELTGFFEGCGNQQVRITIDDDSRSLEDVSLHHLRMFFRTAWGGEHRHSLGIVNRAADDEGVFRVEFPLEELDVMRLAFMLLQIALQHGIRFAFERDQGGLVQELLEAHGISLPADSEDGSFRALVARQAASAALRRRR